jgi:hypothetical protein
MVELSMELPRPVPDRSAGLVRGQADHVLPYFYSYIRTQPTNGGMKILQVWISIVAGEKTSIIDQNDVRRYSVGEYVADFRKDGVVGRPSSSQSAGMVSIEPEESGLGEGVQQLREHLATVSEVQRHLRMVPETSPRGAIQEGIQLDGRQVIEVKEHSRDRLSKIRAGFDEPAQAKVATVLSQSLGLDGLRRWARPAGSKPLADETNLTLPIVPTPDGVGAQQHA